MMLKVSFLAATAVLLALSLPSVLGYLDLSGLSDPNNQDLFVEPAPNALDDSFVVDTTGKKNKNWCKNKGQALKVQMRDRTQWTGLQTAFGAKLPTRIYGYSPGQGASNTNWPGPTIIAQAGTPLCIDWLNKLGKGTHLIEGRNGIPVLDETLHWAYSLSGFENYRTTDNGIPTVAHLHGGHTESGSDGNPEYFFGDNSKGQGNKVIGPRWVKDVHRYENDQKAATLWYHDHALGKL